MNIILPISKFKTDRMGGESVFFSSFRLWDVKFEAKRAKEKWVRANWRRIGPIWPLSQQRPSDGLYTRNNVAYGD